MKFDNFDKAVDKILEYRPHAKENEDRRTPNKAKVTTRRIAKSVKKLDTRKAAIK